MQQLQDLNEAYSRFVPHQFLQFLDKKSIIDVKLGDQVQKTMSVLFADIRAFTTLSEGMNPEENFTFLMFNFNNRHSQVAVFKRHFAVYIYFSFF